MYVQHCAVIDIGLVVVRGTVREGEGSARINISILQGTLGDASISFIVSTTNGSAQGNECMYQQHCCWVHAPPVFTMMYIVEVCMYFEKYSSSIYPQRNYL